MWHSGCDNGMLRLLPLCRNGAVWVAMLVNQALKHQALTDCHEANEPRNFSREQVYRQWVEAARIYAKALLGAPHAPARSPSLVCADTRVFAIRVDHHDRVGLADALRASYRALQSGDMIVVDVPQLIVRPELFGSQRDLVSRALFEAGFERPLIWAGRKLLEAENDASLVNRLLPASALGAGPQSIPGEGDRWNRQPSN